MPYATVYDVDIDGEFAQVAVGNTVNGDLVQQQNTFVRGQPPMYLSSAEVSARVACYMPAPNHELVVKELRQNQAAGLVGPEGSGRATMAIAAMRQLQPDLPIRWFSLEDDDAERGRCRGCMRLPRLRRGLAASPGWADASRAVQSQWRIRGDLGGT